MNIIFYASVMVLSAVILTSCNKNNLDKSLPEKVPDSSLYKIESISPVYQDACNVHYFVDSSVSILYKRIELLWGEDPNFKKYDSITINNGGVKRIDSIIHFDHLKGPATYYFKLKLKSKNAVYETDSKSFAVTPLNISLAAPAFKKGDTTFMVKVDYSPCLETDTAVGIYLNNNIRLKTFGFYCMGLYAYIPDSLVAGRYAMSVRVHNMTIEADSIEILKSYWKLTTSPELPVDIDHGRPNGLGNYAVCGDLDQKSYLIGGALWLDANDYWHQNINTDYYYTRPSFIWEFDVASRSWNKKHMRTPKYFDAITAQYIDNSIYILSGQEMDKNNEFVEFVNSPYRMDLTTMQWQKLSPAPYIGVSQQVSTKINNVFYVGLGRQQLGDWDIHTFNQLWKYNPASNNWTRLADFPGEINVDAGLYVTMTSMEDDIYVYQGTIQTYNEFRGLWKYSTAQDTWTYVDLPPLDVLPSGEKYSIVALKNKLLFFTSQQALFGAGGNYIRTNSASLEFNPATGQYANFSGPPILDIMKVIGHKDNLVYFQSDQRGYNDGIWNYTYEFHYEDH